MVYYIIGIVLFIVLVVLISVQSRKAYIKHEQEEIKYAGKQGEWMFRNMVSTILNDDDVFLNNISLKVDDKNTEIDNLIINKNGIFIIEIKNYNGRIYGNADDYEWIKEKVSPGGNVFEKKVRNPIKQTKRQIYILSKYLKNNNIRIWIKGYTYFINQNSPIEDDCVINNIEELDYIIHEQQDKVYDEQMLHRAINLLSENNSILQ